MKRYAILLFIFFMLGCEPSIIFTENGKLPANSPITLGFKVDSNNEVMAPQVKLFQRYNSTKVLDVKSTLSQKEDASWQLDIAGLAPGEYRLVVNQRYSSSMLGIPLGSHQLTRAYDFVILGSLSAACFRFDDKDNKTMGWTVNGVFTDNQDKPLGSASCPGLFYVNHSWPHALGQSVAGGSIFVPVSDNCFPKPGQQATAKSRWQFSFNSPDLTTNSDWQQLKRLQFRIATKSIPVNVSPEIHYTVGSQKHSTFGHKKLAPRYTVTGGQWINIDHPVELPASARVTGLSLHVSGDPEQTVGSKVDSVYLDGVCPVN